MKSAFKIFVIISVFVLSALGLSSFQNQNNSDASDKKELTNEERIQQRVAEKVAALRQRKRSECEQNALQAAIPIVDSLIAENYAKDLRAKDFILERPDKPTMPEVEIDPFPFDSIE